MDPFKYQSMFPIGADTAQYHLLTTDFVNVESFEGTDVVVIAREGLTLLAEQAFKDVSFHTRPSHLQLLSKILDDPESSKNDKLVALAMINNALVASEAEFPLSQDTGTAIIKAKKGQNIWTDFSDEEALSKGVFNAYLKNPLRYSINAPFSMYEERNTGCNLPAMIEVNCAGGNEYTFIFIAKESESANKTFLYQETKAILNPENLMNFMTEKMRLLGTGASPPYHLVFVIGGTSPDANLRAVSLATSGYLDDLPRRGNKMGHAFRDIDLEDQVFKASCELGIGAQFGGKYFCHDVKVVRLPRHGGSCFVGLGLDSGSDTRIKGKINRNGIFLEKIETEFEQYLPKERIDYRPDALIDLNRPMDEIREELRKYPVATHLQLNGKMVVARDMAHARINALIEKGEDLPCYLKKYVLYYAGPSKIPEGYSSGSFGPTTASRMDPYVPLFQENGGALVSVGKGNRSQGFADSCEKHGGFYLCCPGGMAAVIGKACVTDMEVIDYPDLGMDAVFLITVKNFHVFLMVNDKGNDFFKQVLDLSFAYTVEPHIK